MREVEGDIEVCCLQWYCLLLWNSSHLFCVVCVTLEAAQTFNPEWEGG